MQAEPGVNRPELQPHKEYLGFHVTLLAIEGTYFKVSDHIESNSYDLESRVDTHSSMSCLVFSWLPDVVDILDSKYFEGFSSFLLYAEVAMKTKNVLSEKSPYGSNA